jgi:hypothetical protein
MALRKERLRQAQNNIVAYFSHYMPKLNGYEFAKVRQTKTVTSAKMPPSDTQT